MIKMYVNCKVEGRYLVEVEAETVKEAMEKARDHYYDADFGELCDADMEVVNVEDESGNYLYEC